MIQKFDGFRKGELVVISVGNGTGKTMIPQLILEESFKKVAAKIMNYYDCYEKDEKGNFKMAHIQEAFEGWKVLYKIPGDNLTNLFWIADVVSDNKVFDNPSVRVQNSWALLRTLRNY